MPARSASTAAPCDPAIDTLPIAFIHQDLGLVDWMTVAENVAIQTGYPRSPPRPHLLAAGSQGRAPTRSRSWGAASIPTRGSRRFRPPSARSSRSAGRWRSSPTSSSSTSRRRRLPEADVERLLAALRRLRASGIGIVYVTHRLDEVFRIADRVTVLRDGRRVATVDVARDLAGRSRREDRRPLDERRLRQAGACLRSRRARRSKDAVAERVGPVSFTVAAGETLGLVGLARRRPSHDRPRDLRPDPAARPAMSSLDGQPIDPADPADAMAQAASASSRAGAPRRASPPTWRCARTST